MKIKHHEMVTALAKPGQAIIDTLTPVKMHLLHMTIGLCSEVAELIDGIVVSKGRNNIVEELGDAEFYMEGARQAIEVTREQVLEMCYTDTVDEAYSELFDDTIVGVTVAAGNLLDMVKKHVIYNKPLDVPAIVVHMAAVEYFLSEIRDGEIVSREETLTANIAKLGVRYKAGYSDKAAHERADKAA